MSSSANKPPVSELPQRLRQPECVAGMLLASVLVVVLCGWLTHLLRYGVNSSGGPPTHVAYHFAHFYLIGMTITCFVSIFHLAGPWKTRLSLGGLAGMLLVSSVAASDTDIAWHIMREHDFFHFLHWLGAGLLIALIIRHMHRGRIVAGILPEYKRLTWADYSFVAVLMITLVGLAFKNEFYGHRNIVIPRFLMVVFEGGAFCAVAAFLFLWVGLSEPFRRWRFVAMTLAGILAFIGVLWMMTLLYVKYPELKPYVQLPEYFTYNLPDLLGGGIGVIAANLHVTLGLRWFGFRWEPGNRTIRALNNEL